MIRYIITFILTCILHFVSTTLKAEIFRVASQQEFDLAQNNANPDDTILWQSGMYMDIFMEIDKDDLFILAESMGQTIFSGNSRVDISGDHITFEGFQFLDGDIGTRDVINITGSSINFRHINIRAYTSYKYLRVREASQYVDISYCNFENRLNLDDQNILSILVDDQQAGYHKIRYCSFKNFEGTGNDLGIEPIRIGLSTQADRNSRSLVEYCYFSNCDGDGEIISSKASQNVYRFNTFENNSKAELVLRHGSEAIVYGNFFLNGKGGIRVREGQHHYIYNNYFSGLNDRAIYLQNESSDPLDDINIAFNTIVDCAELILGSDGDYSPTNVTLANNIFSEPQDDLFEDATGTETWFGNISNGSLGITVPSDGISNIDPLLAANESGFFGLSSNSPAINAAVSGHKELPQFQGMDVIDSEILFDLMGQERPSSIEEKDLGCNEFPHEIPIKPIATEENTGPAYNTDMISQVLSISATNEIMLEVTPNPSFGLISITIEVDQTSDLNIDLYNVEGKRLGKLFDTRVSPGSSVLSTDIANYPSGVYTLQATLLDTISGGQKIKNIKIVKQ